MCGFKVLLELGQCNDAQVNTVCNGVDPATNLDWQTAEFEAPLLELPRPLVLYSAASNTIWEQFLAMVEPLFLKPLLNLALPGTSQVLLFWLGHSQTMSDCCWTSPRDLFFA